MFHRVTTEDQNSAAPEAANTNATKEKEAAVQKNKTTEERALYTKEETLKKTPTTASNKPAETKPGKASYTPHLSRTSTYATQNRGQNMTSYTRTPAKDTTDADAAKAHDFSAGSYNRTRSGGYPGTSSYATTARSPAQNTSSGDNDRTLTIGAGITMAGEIESCDYLLVEGTVEAALKGARSLEVAESGVFYGTVEIEEATIAGRFEGDITVHGRLTIQSSGIVTGSITYKELEIESGAIVDGRLTPVAAVAQNAAPAPVATKTRAKTTQATNETEAANTDGQLFNAEAEPTAAE
jgi:cytoskeletal protein CcmA (bactofilin family)